MAGKAADPAMATVARLERALETIAMVVEREISALPIFERIENELERARAAASNDPVSLARALLHAKRAG